MVNLPLTVVLHPAGAEADGSMPSSTAWAKDEAAKKSGARKLEARIVKSGVQARSRGIGVSLTGAGDKMR